jgi:hypothetical protein
MLQGYFQGGETVLCPFDLAGAFPITKQFFEKLEIFRIVLGNQNLHRFHDLYPPW